MGMPDIGGMISGIGSVFLGNDAAQSQAQTAIRQEQLSGATDTYNARQALNRGAFLSGMSRVQSTQLADQQKVAYADSGVDASKGTAASVQANTMGLGELDAQEKMNDAAREAWGFRLQREMGKENLQTQLASAQRNQIGAILGGLSKFASASAGGGGGGGISYPGSGDSGGSSASQAAGDAAFGGG